MLAERGHRVTLCEKNNNLGGNLIPGSVPHFKRYDRALVKWYQRQLELLGVEVKMNCEVKVENISEYKPDEIITATGSRPIQSKFGSEAYATTADEILIGKAEAGKSVVVIGGGLVGCETALWLSQNGSKVTAVTPEGECSFPSDTVVSAIGYRENNALYNELKDLDIPAHNIGDSQKVHNIMYSIWNSYELAREL